MTVGGWGKFKIYRLKKSHVSDTLRYSSPRCIFTFTGGRGGLGVGRDIGVYRGGGQAAMAPP